MMKRFLLIIAVVALLAPVLVFAKFGLEEAAKDTGLIKGNETVNASQELPALVGKIVGAVLSLLGIIFFLLVLYAGFLWMSAFGKADKIDRAKEILEGAGIGLVIVLAAYAITTFVFSNLGVGGEKVSGQIGCCCQGTACEDGIESEFCATSGGTFTATCPALIPNCTAAGGTCSTPPCITETPFVGEISGSCPIIGNVCCK